MIAKFCDFLRAELYSSKKGFGILEISKGWSPKFETGLNVKIGIHQKIYE